MNITLNVNFGLSEDLKALLLQGAAAIATRRSSDLSSDAQAVVGEPKPEPTKTRRKAAEKPQPAAPADPAPEAAAQDAADEAAEQEAAAAPAEPDAAPVVTRDDLRNAAGAYARLYGMPAAQEDGAKIIDLPGVAALSKVPDEEVAAVTAKFKAALESNPYGRAKVA